MSAKDGWHLQEGDALTPELTAMRLLGGGAAYEAYLAFDEVTYGPVVVKVVRPDQVDDGHTLRGLAREVETLGRIHHPVVVRGLRHQLDGERPHLVLEHVEGPRLSSLIAGTGGCPSSSTSRWRSMSPPPSTSSGMPTCATSTSSRAT